MRRRSVSNELLLATIRRIEVTVPPLPVQRRIAGILSAYDELMENSQRRIRLLEAMARALYREWFVHFRFPGHERRSSPAGRGGGEGRAKLVTSPLGDIPQGWEVKKLAEFAGITVSAHARRRETDCAEMELLSTTRAYHRHRMRALATAPRSSRTATSCLPQHAHCRRHARRRVRIASLTRQARA